MDPNSEKMLKLMEKMKLSETEKTSVKIGGVVRADQQRRDPQAMAKVMVECPIKGVECKDLGEN